MQSTPSWRRMLDCFLAQWLFDVINCGKVRTLMGRRCKDISLAMQSPSSESFPSPGSV